MIEVPNNKQVIYDVQNVDIATGGGSDSKSASLRKGVCVGVKFIDFTKSENRAFPVFIGLEDNSGSDILKKTDIRDYDVIGGGYFGSFKPCNFDTSNPVNVQVTAKQALTADFSGQVIFAILIDKPVKSN